jgi:hypothetical protein
MGVLKKHFTADDLGVSVGKAGAAKPKRLDLGTNEGDAASMVSSMYNRAAPCGSAL